MKIYPIHVETLILGSGVHRIANISEDYISLMDHPGGEHLEAENNRSESAPEQHGICLHFILPQEWRHGEQREDGSVSYRKLPNRWSVTRYAIYEEEGKKLEFTRKDWMIESNLLKEKKDASLRGVKIGYEDAGKPWRIIGEQREYDGIVTTEGKHLEDLTAVSKGIDYFTGYYPECRSVLGFHDSTDDLKLIQKGEEDRKRYLLTYAVSGWYEGEGSEGSCGMVHGYVTDIRWFGREYLYDSGIPKRLDMPRAAIGNSAEEAVAALLAYYSGKKEDEELLKYLFYQVLPELGKLDGLRYGKQKIRQGKFVPVAASEQLVIDGEEVAYTEEKVRLLRKIERLRREREKNEGAQQELYQTMYLMWVRAAGWDKEYQDEACARIIELQERLRKLKTEYQKKYTQEVENGLKEELTRLLGEKEALKETAGERYYKPADYTILLEGGAQSTVYQEIEAQMEDGKTPCREEADIIETVQITVSHDEKEEVFEITYLHLDTQENVRIPLPHTAELLAREAALISRGTIYYLTEGILEQMGLEKTPLNRTYIVQSYEKSLPDGIGDKKLPSSIGRFLWRPPWNPLFLEWSLLYTPEEQGLPYGSSREVLNGKTERDMVIQGRSLLTSTSAEAILQLFEGHSKDEEYLSYVMKLRSMRILSQKLSGMHDAMLTRTRNVLVYPQGDFPAPVMEAVTEAFVNLKDGYLDRNHTKGRKKEPMEEFHAVREGLFRLFETGQGRFRIIDSFGRILDYPAEELILSHEISNKGIGKEWSARRRIVAPLRIHASWEYRRVVSSSDEMSPVYGWIWANLSDSCLHIYASDGTFAGTVQAYYLPEEATEKTVKIALRNPPAGSETQEMLLQRLSPEMRGFLEEFLKACNREPETFYEMLKLLDDSMWNIRDNHCTWLGHPVVLAGAQVTAELKGNPPQPIFYHGESYDSELMSMEYEMHVGEAKRQKDGVIGFYSMKREGFAKLHYCVEEAYRSSYYDSESTVSVHLNQPEELIFLMSPYGEVTLDMELLPVKRIKLNEKSVEKALEQIFMVIYSAPVLTQKNELQLLVPDGMEKEWKFLEIPVPGERGAIREIKLPPMEAGQQEIDQEITEGWLILEAMKRRETDVQERDGSSAGNMQN